MHSQFPAQSQNLWSPTSSSLQAGAAPECTSSMTIHHRQKEKQQSRLLWLTHQMWEFSYYVEPPSSHSELTAEGDTSFLCSKSWVCSLGGERLQKARSERIEMKHVFSYPIHHWLLLRMLLSTAPNWWEQEFVIQEESSHHSQANWWHKPRLKHL